MRWGWLVLSLLYTSGAESSWSCEPLYFGLGFGNTKVSGVNERRTTVQALAGYDLTDSLGIDYKRYMLAAELGYQDTDHFRHDGKWLSLVAGYRFIEEMEVILRGGIESGHDVGTLVGAGIGYGFYRNMQLRLEYVEREELRGVQLNVVLHPWMDKERLRCDD